MTEKSYLLKCSTPDQNTAVFSCFDFLITQYIYIYIYIYIYTYIFTIKVICLGEIQYCFQFQRKCQKHFWLLPFEQNLVQSLKQILKKKIIWRKSSAFVPTLSKLWVTAYQWVNISSKSTIKTPEQRLQILLRYLYCWLWTSVCSPGKHLNYLQNKTPRCFILMLV